MDEQNESCLDQTSVHDRFEAEWLMSLTTYIEKTAQASLFPRAETPPSAATRCFHANYIIRLGIHCAFGWKQRGLAVCLDELNPAHRSVLAPRQPIWSELVPIAKKRDLRGSE